MLYLNLSKSIFRSWSFESSPKSGLVMASGLILKDGKSGTLYLPIRLSEEKWIFARVLIFMMFNNVHKQNVKNVIAIILLQQGMGNNLCCENSIAFPHFRSPYELAFEEKIIEFLTSHPTVFKLKKDTMRTEDGYQEMIIRKFNIETIKQFPLSDGTFIGDAKISRYQKNGFGIMLSHDGSYYEGEWKNNMKNGKGLYIHEAGEYYEGEWKQNLPDGYGTLKSLNPFLVYKGEWQKGMKNGQGIEEYKDGSIYSGDFKKGKKDGYGKFEYADGTYYEGNFDRNTINGEGTYVGQLHRYKGEWKNGKMHGTGRSEWFNSEGKIVSTYFGQYCDGKKEGFGEYKDSKGRRYKAQWISGQLYDKWPLATENLALSKPST